MWRGQESQTLGQFRSDLAWALIDNHFLDKNELPNEPKKKRSVVVEHVLISAPKKAKKWDGRNG